MFKSLVVLCFPLVVGNGKTVKILMTSQGGVLAASHNPGTRGPHSPHIQWESCPLEFCCRQWLALYHIIKIQRDSWIFIW